MDNKTIETIDHDYTPVNKYIDEKARLRRTRSVWGYTRSLALFLIALGIFLILAAYAYHIFKKPHLIQKDEINYQKSENINKEIINKNKQIDQIKEKINENPENQKLKQQLEKLQKEKNDIEKKLEEQNKKIVDGEVIKYNRTTHQFETVERDGYSITTRRKYPTTTDLLEQTGNYDETCYLARGNINFEYDQNQSTQQTALSALNLTLDQAKTYEKYCKRTK